MDHTSIHMCDTKIEIWQSSCECQTDETTASLGLIVTLWKPVVSTISTPNLLSMAPRAIGCMDYISIHMCVKRFEILQSLCYWQSAKTTVSRELIVIFWKPRVSIIRTPNLGLIASMAIWYMDRTSLHMCAEIFEIV